MRSLLPTLLTCGLAALSACNGLADCSDEPNLSGEWTIQASPMATDAAALMSSFSIDAMLSQQSSGSDPFNITHWVYGTLAASDPSVFGTLTIPQLMHNTNGLKTGAVLGCTLQINVPIATPVTDDNVDQGPERISLTGNITQKGVMASSESTESTVILVSDETNTPRPFTWTATQN